MQFVHDQYQCYTLSIAIAILRLPRVTKGEAKHENLRMMQGNLLRQDFLHHAMA